MVNAVEVRRRCRIYAQRFGYDLRLFNRIPIYIFEYFRSDDPLSTNTPSFCQIELMSVFMIINNISSDLMMAFYAAGDQGLDVILRLHTFFFTMWRVYETSDPDDLLGLFGTFFAYHLESRTLRRIDMSIVSYNSGQRQQNNFVPNHIRNLIRRGVYRIENEYDLEEVRTALRGGLINRGRFNRN